MNTSQRLTTQIEGEASYYPPEVYDLLTFHNRMFETSIEDASNYFPLTATRLDSYNIIPFIIGILPPTANITGRLLDRSNSLGGSDAYKGFNYDVFDVETLGLIEGALPASRGGSSRGNVGRVVGRGSPGALGPGVKVESEPLPAGAIEVQRVNTRLTPAQVHAVFTEAYRSLGRGEPTTALIDILVTQSSIETAFWNSMPNYNFAGVKGKGPTKYTVYSWTWENYTRNATPENPKGKTRVWGAFQAYDSALAGAKAYVGTLARRYSAALALAAAGDVDGYARALANPSLNGGYSYYTADVNEYAGAMTSRYGQFSGGRYAGKATTAGLTIKNTPLRGGGSRSVSSGRGGGGVSRPAAETLWSVSGKKKAMDAARAEIALANKDAGKTTIFEDSNLGERGQKYAAAQEQLAAYLRDEQEKMAQTPPLQFLINPQSFSVSESKIVTNGNWARNGPVNVVEHWGDGQATITAQGRIAGFYASPLGPDEVGKSGLSRSGRTFTMAYQNLMSAYLLYRNNGTLWSFEDISRASDVTVLPDQLAFVSAIYLYYDRTLYIGSFNSFQLTEEAEAPFTVSYTFEFVARQIVVLDKTESPVLGDFPLFYPAGNGQSLPPDSFATSGAVS